MKFQTRRYWLFVLLGLVLVTSFQPAKNCVVAAASDDDNDTIQENPSFSVETDGDDSDDDGSDYDSDDEDDDGVPSKEATKSILSKALAKPKKAAQLAKKHKTKIILVLVVYAFRKEIKNFVHKLLSVPVYDRETGRQIGRTVSVNPTSILKLIFFLQLMWKTFRPNESDASSPSLLMPHDAAVAAAFFPGIKSTVYVPPTEQHWTFERMNQRYEKDGLALQKAMGELEVPKTSSASTSTNSTATEKSNTPLSLSGFLKEMLMPKSSDSTVSNNHNGTVIVMDLTKLSSNVVQMELIRDQVSFLLSQHRANQTRHISDDQNAALNAEMEIIILLESPGGGASDYGLAAEQLMRLRNQAGIKLTICVDKVAASGGYMMAATGHEILAAPFAILGSIGVYGQTINVHELLQGWGVKDMIFRAGKNKAPLGLIGEVTQEGKTTIQTMIDATHVAFKYHIATVRPSLRDVIDEVATGDIWLGYNALDRGLIDRLVTSDEYIGERMEQGARVLKLIRYRKPHFGFGPRSSSEYSVSMLVRSVAAHMKHILVGSVEETESINTRSLSANMVQTKSPIA